MGTSTTLAQPAAMQQHLSAAECWTAPQPGRAPLQLVHPVMSLCSLLVSALGIQCVAAIKTTIVQNSSLLAYFLTFLGICVNKLFVLNDSWKTTSGMHVPTRCAPYLLHYG